MVFKKEAAPKTRAVFMEWYFTQTKWSEDHSYDDPVVTCPELNNWFMEMITAFPAMNGPYATDIEEDAEDADILTDYCIGKVVIYVGFRWSVAEQSYGKMLELAKKHQVGFFDVSEDNGAILFPRKGLLIPIEDFEPELKTQIKNKWWKFW
jgi:hypothetical protein